MRRITGIETERYWQSVGRQLRELPSGERNAVIFIHGYNVSFDGSAIRAAQLGFDLGVGTMAFFSWPSRGMTTRRAYQSDGQTIGASEAAIVDYLVDFATRSGADAIHLIVHSMGNQGVLRAVNRIVADAERRNRCRFGQIILAAADVDADTFGSLAAAYRELAARTTLYVSQRDLALRASAWFAEYPRVGLYPPVSVFDGIDTVSVTNVDLTVLGHGYVGGARDVLQDMHRLIFNGAAATLRPEAARERRGKDLLGSRSLTFPDGAGERGRTQPRYIRTSGGALFAVDINSAFRGFAMGVFPQHGSGWRFICRPVMAQIANLQESFQETAVSKTGQTEVPVVTRPPRRAQVEPLPWKPSRLVSVLTRVAAARNRPRRPSPRECRRTKLKTLTGGKSERR
jgi:pimeloyl-ACP methyl ester carboxylesterase